MTDRDVVESAVKLIREIGERDMTIRTRPLPSGKTAYATSITGLPAAKVMWSVLPFMGIRRARDIRRVLTEWAPKVYREASTFRREIMEAL